MSLQDKKNNNTLKKSAIKTSMSGASLSHIVLSVGLKAQDSEQKHLGYILEQLSLVSGQKATIVRSKKAISNFKLRQNMPVGCIVTLRKEKMHNFLKKLTNIALPRIRDFRGLPSTSFNSSNHYSFGIKDHTIFPEVESDKILRSFGLNIALSLKSKSQKQSLELLKGYNMPLK